MSANIATDRHIATIVNYAAAYDHLPKGMDRQSFGQMMLDENTAHVNDLYTQNGHTGNLGNFPYCHIGTAIPCPMLAIKSIDYIMYQCSTIRGYEKMPVWTSLDPIRRYAYRQLAGFATYAAQSIFEQSGTIKQAALDLFVAFAAKTYCSQHQNKVGQTLRNASIAALNQDKKCQSEFGEFQKTEYAFTLFTVVPEPIQLVAMSDQLWRLLDTATTETPEITEARRIIRNLLRMGIEGMHEYDHHPYGIV